MPKLLCRCAYVMDLSPIPVGFRYRFLPLSQSDEVFRYVAQAVQKDGTADEKLLGDNINDMFAGFSDTFYECPNCKRLDVFFDDRKSPDEPLRGRFFIAEGRSLPRAPASPLHCACGFVFDLNASSVPGEHVFFHEDESEAVTDALTASALRTGTDDFERLQKGLVETFARQGSRFYRCPSCCRLLVFFSPEAAQSYRCENGSS